MPGGAGQGVNTMAKVPCCVVIERCHIPNTDNDPDYDPEINQWWLVRVYVDGWDILVCSCARLNFAKFIKTVIEQYFALGGDSKILCVRGINASPYTRYRRNHDVTLYPN